jgi:membrane protein
LEYETEASGVMFRKMIDLIKETYTAWSGDKAERMAASLAYYTLFSFAPLVVVAVAVAGFVFGEEAARGQIARQFRDMLGPQAAEAVQSMIAAAYKPSSGIIATIIGVATLLAGAAGLFAQLQDAFNTIWRVEAPKKANIWATIKSRFLSFAMVLGVGFVLMVSLVLSAALSAVSQYLGDRLPGSEYLWRLLELGSSFLVVSLLFAMLFKFLPDTDVQWRDVWVGALSTAALFTLGKYLIGLYLGRSSVASAYGAAGSLVVLLLWIYYAAEILYFGAELTRVYSTKFGSRSPAGAAEDATGITDALAPIRMTNPLPDPHQEALPVAALRDREPAFEKDIQKASLIGAAIGLVIGLLRPAKKGPKSEKRVKRAA